MPTPLIALGDSLTQGFQHGAIRRTDWSYPAMVARVLAPQRGFRQAEFDATEGAGVTGPLVDVEVVVRMLSDRFGAKLQLWDLPSALLSLRDYMGRGEKYWEDGAGTEPSATGPLHHNLAVWGFEVLDLLNLSDAVCFRNTGKASNGLLNQVPEYAMYRTARRVLNPQQRFELSELSPVQLAERVALEEGGADNLLVSIGANNALGTCITLQMKWSQSADFRKLAHQRYVTIWEPDHFAKIYGQLVAGLKRVQAKHTFLATVPHVTVAPVARGVSPRARRRGEPELVNGYFEHYTRFWIWDDDFDPKEHPSIKREDAQAVDHAIDQYNAHIRETAQANGWHVVDFARMLDDLAFRRNKGRITYPFPEGLVNALRDNPATSFRVRPDGALLLDSRFFGMPEKFPAATASSEEWQRAVRGGLFSLDGVHPTTVGYGLMAHEVLTVMKAAGVPQANPDALPWAEIVAADSLLTSPPALLTSLGDTLNFLFVKLGLQRMMDQVSGYGSQPLRGA
jgi:lysophospholipase L1-like esterase